MHSTACGVGASATNLASLQTSSGSSSAAAAKEAAAAADALKMVHHSNDDAMNKIPLKSSSGLDDEEKNGGELMQDTAAAEEARREQMRANVLAWMKKLTIGLICFIGIALISYVIISLCFSDWPKSTPLRNSNSSSSSTVGTTATPAAATTIEADPAPILSPATATATAATSTTSTTTTTTTESTTSTTTTTTTTIPTTTAAATTSTNNTLISFIPPTDEQPLAATSQEHSGNMEATTLSASGDIAGPAVAASTLATTPPAAAAAAATAATTNAHSDNTQFVSKLGVYEQAAVCSDQSICSQAGSDILARNGSAVDATIAIMLCNGLLSSQSMGIGGGLLMNIYDRASKAGYQIDAHEVAPYAADASMFDKNASYSLTGPLSIAVPGEVKGYQLAHERFGKLPWRELVAPSLKICESGYHMTKHQENGVRIKWSKIKDIPQYRELFLNPETGEHYKAGAFIKAPKQLCKTYQLLADNGPMDFYNGTISKLLAEDLKEMGSIITQDDLISYHAEVRLSITMPLANGTLYVVPPVSSGSVTAHVLSILEGFNLTRSDLLDDESYARTVHRIVEALKLGYARRAELGDPRFNEVRELVSQLNSPEYAAEQRIKLNDSHVLGGPTEYGALFADDVEDHGTSHISVLAPNGDAVSVTSSINLYFGADRIGKRTGIILNNGMNDFSVQQSFFDLPQSPANVIELHKRPMSSQSPLLLTDQEGNIRLAIGAAGGSKIIAAVVQVAARYLWLGDDLKAAIDVPRFYHQLIPDVLEYEQGALSESVQKLLIKRGHKLKPLGDPYGSVVCAIARNATAIYANADHRKRGEVAGF